LESSIILFRTLNTFVSTTRLRELSSVLKCRSLKISNSLPISEKELRNIEKKRKKKEKKGEE
jgi:hypothetical protein